MIDIGLYDIIKKKRGDRVKVNFETVSIEGLNKIIFLIRSRESINSFTIFYLKVKEFLINF